MLCCCRQLPAWFVAAFERAASYAGGNNITRSDRSFEFQIVNTDDGTATAETALLNGATYDASVTVEAAGASSLAVLFQGTYLPGYPASLTVLPGPPSAANSVMRTLPAAMTAGELLSVRFEGRDAFNNLV